MNTQLDNLQADLKALSSKQKAESSAWFFQTGKGGYAEGDKFIGVTVPEQRQVAKKYAGLSFGEIADLLHSDIHEFRLTALIILVNQFEKSLKSEGKSDLNVISGNQSRNKLHTPRQSRTPLKRGQSDSKNLQGLGDTVATSTDEIYEFYLENRVWVNNWDLVDSSAWQIMGRYLWLHSEKKSVIYRLAESSILWERRIAILTTFYFIKQKDFSDSFKLAYFLMPDRNDLIQKALGWMLREIGKLDEPVLRKFLDENSIKLGRTCLRYAIEKFPENIQKEYLGRR